MLTNTQMRNRKEDEYVMAYLVNTKTGRIHDASKSHVKNHIGSHYEKVDTLPEAKAKATKNGQKPCACRRCGFNPATIEECNI